MLKEPPVRKVHLDQLVCKAQPACKDSRVRLVQLVPKVLKVQRVPETRELKVLPVELACKAQPVCAVQLALEIREPRAQLVQREHKALPVLREPPVIKVRRVFKVPLVCRAQLACRAPRE